VRKGGVFPGCSWLPLAILAYVWVPVAKVIGWLRGEK
jgi:hypothetical protein